MSKFRRISVLNNAPEAGLLAAVLAERDIPHTVVNYEERTAGSLPRFPRGWGHVEAPGAFGAEIRDILDGIREGGWMPEDSELPHSETQGGDAQASNMPVCPDAPVSASASGSAVPLPAEADPPASSMPLALPESLVKHMSETKDEDLHKILYIDDRNDWTPEAILAADQEWKHRGLSADQVHALEASRQEQNLLADELADEPLSFLEGIGFFCLVGVLAMPWVFRLRDQGYRRKFRQAWICMGMGLLFWIVAKMAISHR